MNTVINSNIIAAMVIVIISSGISNKPITPKIKKVAIKFGTTPINDSLMFLNQKHYLKFQSLQDLRLNLRFK